MAEFESFHLAQWRKSPGAKLKLWYKFWERLKRSQYLMCRKQELVDESKVWGGNILREIACTWKRDLNKAGI